MTTTTQTLPPAELSAPPKVQEKNRPREEVKSKPTSSFRLKEALAETSKEPSVRSSMISIEQKLMLEARDPFDVERVEQAFDEYIRIHKPETTLIIALKAHKPEIENYEVTLEIDNQLQLEKLEAVRVSLQNCLMKTLNNGAVAVAFRFFDDKSGKEEIKPITSQDKLVHFIKQNPIVGEMKKMFGLELE